MGAFFAIRRIPSENHEARLTVLKRELALQGFRDPKVLQTDTLDFYIYKKQESANINYVEYPNGDFIASVGTLIFESQCGEKALKLIYQSSLLQEPPALLEKALGNYCLVLHMDDITSIWIDPLGTYKVFRDREASIWSSSFLAVLIDAKNPKINRQSVFEYVFQGATYGNSTIIENIELLDPQDDPIIESSHDRKLELRLRTPLWNGGTKQPDPETHLRHLRSTYETITRCFGEKIDTALSGGYDSRLTLALLLEQGIKPRVHVYGNASDPDVQVAKHINSKMNLGLEHIDKSTLPTPDPEEFQEIVVENFFKFDGYPIDGVFRSQSDLQSRISRCHGGYLALNGGGGEIFRNFYNLPDRSLSIWQLLWAFYSRFDPQTCTADFSETTYYKELAIKIRQTLGLEGDKLTRSQVELIYPLFGCRFWMGRNNSLNNRFGFALTPFIEYASVRDAANIPLRRKNFGQIEGEMIKLVNHRLASYVSSYGHNFDGNPSLIRKCKESLSYLRPPLIRKYIFRAKTRMRPAERPIILSVDYVAPIIGTHFPYMSKLFHVDFIRDCEQLNRIYTLELLFQKYGADH